MDLQRFNNRDDPMSWLYLGMAFQVLLVVLILTEVGPPAAAFAGATIGCLISVRRLLRQPEKHRG